MEIMFPHVPGDPYFTHVLLGYGGKGPSIDGSGGCFYDPLDPYGVGHGPNFGDILSNG